MKIHDTEGHAHFEQLRLETAESIQRFRRLAEKEGADHQIVFHQLMLMFHKNACIGIILGDSDSEIASLFRKSAGYAVDLLEAAEGRINLRSFDVDLESGPQGLVKATVNPRVFGPNEGRLSVDKFINALDTITAFGDSTAVRVAASYPEKKYLNPNVVAEEGTLEDLRARTALLRGEVDVARKEIRSALSLTRNPRVKPAMEALEAILLEDKDRFLTALNETLKQHKKFYRRYPHVPDGIVCMRGLASCRFAADRALCQVEDQAYLPTRFLTLPMAPAS